MAKVCLVRPPFFKIFGVEKVHLPLSIGYLASYLENSGHKVSFVDGEVINYNIYNGFLDKGLINAFIFYADPYFMERRFKTVSKIMENKDDKVWEIFVDKIKAEKPDIIGISCYTVNMTSVNILANKIKKELGNIPIVLGGTHPTAAPKRTLDEVKGADYVVVGEGEETCLELVNQIEEKKSKINIDGVLSRENTDFRPRVLIKDLDSIPFPKRDFYDKSKYIFGAPLLTSRGCVYRCTFCASHIMWSRKVRFRSVNNVIEELKILKSKYNIERIRILDDTFVLNKKWIKEFCAALKDNNLKFTFNCSGRINTVDEELLALLHENGFDSIAFGVESGSPRIVNKIKKDIDLNKVTEVITLANKYGFDTTSFFMTGHPDETLEDIRMSEELFRKSRSKRGELSMLIPYTQTEVGDIAERKGFRFGIENYYKFYHVRGRVLVNLTKLSDQELLREHKRFEKIIKQINYKTLVKKVIKLMVSSTKKKIKQVIGK